LDLSTATATTRPLDDTLKLPAKPKFGESATVGTNKSAGTFALATSAEPGLLGDEWDSGKQQCNLDGKKILYRFWKRNNPQSWDPGAWTVYHSVGAEDKKKTGSGWKESDTLVSIYYFFSYGDGTAPVTGTRPITHQWNDEGVLAVGSGSGGFKHVQIKVSRLGGKSGVSVNWPGSGCYFG
jgi:hypothetical protein